MDTAYPAPTGWHISVILCLVLAVFVGVPAAFVVAADPCHVFHKPWPGRWAHGFTPDTRCQNAGLINSWLVDPAEGFDSILIGASTAENFNPPHIRQVTPWQRTLKLTAVGLSPAEHNILINRAIATGRVRHVFWEIVPMLYHMPVPRVTYHTLARSTHFPAYLYNNSVLDDYRYVFNSAVLSGAVDVVNQETYFAADIDKVRYWENRCASMGICDQHMSAEEIDTIRAAYRPVHRRALDPAERAALDYSEFERFLMPVVQAHCNGDITFDIFFSPFSLLWFAELDEAKFQLEFYLLRHVVERVSHCRNIRVFAFYNDVSIVGDLSNYKDPRHFYADVHDRIIDAIAADRYRVTPEQLEAFEQAWRDNINTYQPYGTRLYPH